MSIALPAYLRNHTSPLAVKLAAGLGIPQPPRISIKDDRFTLIGANGEPHGKIKPSLTLDVIIVGGNEHPSRIYYETYDPVNPAAPDCFSDNGVSPSSQAAKPQAEFCSSCEQAVWGAKVSQMTGKGIPACATHKKVAVVAAEDTSATVYLLSIPPASLKPWVGYLAHLGGQGIGPEQVITQLSMESKTLSFTPVDFIPEDFVEPIYKIVNSDEPNIVSGALDKPREVRQISARPEQREEAPSSVSAAAPEDQPKRSRGRPRNEQETVIGKKSPQELEAEVEQLRQPGKSGFLQAGGKQAFGVAADVPPPSADVQDMLSKAFSLPTRS